MKTGAGISGGLHVGLVALVIMSGELFSEGMAKPVPIAEVTLMTGTEFEAATSAAPTFNADLPPSPETPNEAEDIAAVTQADEDAVPTQATQSPDEPQQGEVIEAPDDRPATPDIAEVGDRPAAPAAPADDAIVSVEERSDEIAPVAETPSVAAPAPAARPSAPSPDTTAEAPPEPEPDPAPEPAVVEAPEDPATEEPEPEETVAEAEPEKLNDPDVPAPKLAPPPPSKPRDVAEAKKAERLAREAKQQEQSGATETAEAPRSTGTTQTVGRLSFRDKDSLRVGIRGFFNPPQGLPNAETLAVKLRIEMSPQGRIVAGPTVRAPARLDRALDALKRAGIRALKKAEAAGVFARLPQDKYARWRVIDVIFTPEEVRFL